MLDLPAVTDSFHRVPTSTSFLSANELVSPAGSDSHRNMNYLYPAASTSPSAQSLLQIQEEPNAAARHAIEAARVDKTTDVSSNNSSAIPPPKGSWMLGVLSLLRCLWTCTEGTCKAVHRRRDGEYRTYSELSGILKTGDVVLFGVQSGSDVKFATCNPYCHIGLVFKNPPRHLVSGATTRSEQEKSMAQHPLRQASKVDLTQKALTAEAKALAEDIESQRSVSLPSDAVFAEDGLYIMEATYSCLDERPMGGLQIVPLKYRLELTESGSMISFRTLERVDGLTDDRQKFADVLSQVCIVSPVSY